MGKNSSKDLRDTYAEVAKMSREKLARRAKEIENQRELINNNINLIERQKNEIRELKEKLELFLCEKLFSKETELDNFVERLRINYK